MAIYIGNNELSNITMGNSELDSVYIGSTKLWEKEYLPVEYICSTGTQVILIDIVPTMSDRYEFDLKFTSSTSSSIFFGGIQNKNNTEYTRFLMNWPVNDIDKMLGRYLFSAGSWTTLPNTRIKTNRNTLILNGTSGSYGGNTLNTITVSLPTDMTIPIAIFGYANGETISDTVANPFFGSQMTLYKFQIYNSNNQLTHNFIPVERNSDKELGLLDTITNKFYTNVGTGTFIKGGYI